MEIGGKKIGATHPAFIIAEVAQAHDGSLGAAHAYIDLAKSIGADAVKFQTHIADAETTPLEEFRVKIFPQDKTRFEYWQRMEFSAEQWAGLVRHAEECGIIFLSSAFSLEAVEILNKLGMPAWKIASGEVTNQELLDGICETNKPILLSSGMSPWNEIDAIIDMLKGKTQADLGLFQCTSKYPTKLEDVGLNIIRQMQERYNLPVGLSDHSGSIYPSLAAIAQGAHLIEAHICLHKMQFGPDTSASLTPDEFKQVCQARDAFHTMAVHPVTKNDVATELDPMRKLFTKSIALKANQPSGTCLTRDMLTAKKPGTGIPISDVDRIVGRRLKRDVTSRELIVESDLE